MKISSKDEQDICISCGFCCDRTLFDVAKLDAEEILRGKFIDLETHIDGNRFFKLPCPYFDQKCTIYDQDKPNICGKFKCQLLRATINGESSKEDTLKTIANAKNLRDELLADYQQLTKNQLTFRELYLRSLKEEEQHNDPELKKIYYRVTLLEILLAKHFKSDDLFRECYEIID